MNAYIYQAELWCETCAVRMRAEITAEHQVDRSNSDEYPKGPYQDGGGEADSPQCCGFCDKFLQNPLTAAGERYLREMIIDGLIKKRGKAELLLELVDFYDLRLADLLMNKE